MIGWFFWFVGGPAWRGSFFGLVVCGVGFGLFGKILF